MVGQEVWIDERGGKVQIVPFFSQLFKDWESGETDQQIFKYNLGKPDRLFFSWQDFLRGNYRGGFFGKAEIESIAGEILIVSAMVSRTVGVAKEEAFDFLASGHFLGITGDQYFLEELVRAGFLRERLIKGMLVLFPTEKMLRKYRCRRTQEHKLVTTGLRVSLRGNLTDQRGGSITVDCTAEVWTKHVHSSIVKALRGDGYAVLRADYDDMEHVLLLTKGRLTEVVRLEEAEWLGELFCAEVLRRGDASSNALALYEGDIERIRALSTEIFVFRGSNTTVIKVKAF